MLSPSLFLILSSPWTERERTSSLEFPFLTSEQDEKGEPAIQHPSLPHRQKKRECDCYLCSQSNWFFSAYFFARCFSRPPGNLGMPLTSEYLSVESIRPLFKEPFLIIPLLLYLFICCIGSHHLGKVSLWNNIRL